MRTLGDSKKKLRSALIVLPVLGLLASPILAASNPHLPGPRVARNGPQKDAPPPPIVRVIPPGGSGSGSTPEQVLADMSSRGDARENARDRAESQPNVAQIETPVSHQGGGTHFIGPRGASLQRALFVPTLPPPRQPKRFFEVTKNGEEGVRAEGGLTFAFR
jgi:hypothetical protein